MTDSDRNRDAAEDGRVAMTLVADVVLDISTRALDRPYTYVVDTAAASAEEPAELTLFDEAGWFNDGSPEGASAESPAAVEEPFSHGLDGIAVGCAVLVPFGGRVAVGLVTALREAGEEDMRLIGAGKMKPVTAVVSKPYFDEAAAEAARHIAKRYIAPLASAIRLFTPPGALPQVVHDGRGRWHLKEQAVAEVDDRWAVLLEAGRSYKPRANAYRQQTVLEALKQGDMKVTDLASELGAVSSVLHALEKKGLIAIEHRRRMRGIGPAAVPNRPSESATAARTDNPVDAAEPIKEAVVLTEGQSRALEAIENARAARDGSVVLVDGVTGSGKTEVYLRAISRVIAEGKNAVVLVPEISLTPQTVARFRGRFGEAVAVMHSRMSAGERYDAWDFIASGAARVVVGARSALFAPLKDVGLIVIDEEHEGSYKQDSAPRYHARDVAEWLMRRAGGVLVLGSATPSIEALHRAETDPRWTHVALPERANGRPMPAITVVDMAREFQSGSRAMFSKELTRRLVEELEQGNKAVLLLNQRGFAKFLLCRDCGYVPVCPTCMTSLTYHEQGHKLVCHHCGHEEPAPNVCPECGSPYLKKFGAGTQRVEMELRALIDAEVEGGADIPLIRMDADTTKTKGAHGRLLEQFAAAERAVLLGTQMIAKGLDFDDVTLVGVINADTQLHLPDYRAGERTFDLIEQVAGRAGRGERGGTVVVQTYEPTSPAIAAAARYDRAAFLADELEKRKMLQYPPYTAMANVLIWGKDEDDVASVAEDLYRTIEPAIAERIASEGDGGMRVAAEDSPTPPDSHPRVATPTSWGVLAPVPCVLERLRGNFRRHIVVRGPSGEEISALLTPLLRKRPADAHVNVAVDIDPVDML